MPTNTAEKEYSASMNITLPSWTQAEETVIFSCIDGYISKKQDKVDVCVNTQLFCPIGEVLARVIVAKKTEEEEAKAEEGTEKKKAAAPTLKNTRTDTICVMPALAILRPIPSEATAVTLDCPVNTYSDVIPNAGTAHLRCVACPEGKVSLKGSFALSDCYKACDSGSVVNPDNPEQCLPCSENSTYDEATKACVCNSGYSGTGIGPGTCKPCEIGSYCPGGPASEKCNPDIDQYSDKEGAGECKYCPPASKSVEGKDCSCIRNGRKFNASKNECE
jgi:hypothetical protein